MIMRTLRTQVKWIMISVVVVFVLSILFMYGGGSRGGKPESGDYPVAEINSMTLMRSQLYRSMVNLAEQSGRKDISPQDIVNFRIQVVNDLAVGDELKKEVKNRKIKVSEEDVNASYQELEDQFPTRESFMEYMKQMGITESKLKEQIREDLSRRALIQQAEEGVVVTPEELQEGYDALKDMVFSRPHVIYVRVADFGSKDHTAQEAVEQMQDGVSWNAMIATYLEDLRDFTSGDETIPFAENRVPPVLWDAMAEMGDARVAGPVELTSQDFYVLEKVSEELPRVLPLEEVSGDIQEMVLAQKKQNARNQFFETLLKRAKIKILDESLFTAPPVESEADVQAEEEGEVLVVDEVVAEEPATEESEGESENP